MGSTLRLFDGDARDEELEFLQRVTANLQPPRVVPKSPEAAPPVAPRRDLFMEGYLELCFVNSLSD